MTWALSSTGRVLDLQDVYAVATRMSVAEIAHSLACINRYNGHALRPVSVAEHSLLAAQVLADDGAPPLVQLAGLLHDAHECIAQDLTSPAKQVIGAAWRAWEEPWEHAFHKAFGLEELFRAHRAAIRRADLVALATERRDLMHPDGPPWEVLQGVQPHPHVRMRDHDAFTWDDWRQAFIDLHDELQWLHRQRCA